MKKLIILAKTAIWPEFGSGQNQRFSGQKVGQNCKINR
jgi:hypothetical protein